MKPAKKLAAMAALFAAVMLPAHAQILVGQTAGSAGR